MAEFLTQVPTILRVGITGFAFLLMYLAYGLLRTTTSSRAPNPLNVRLISIFMGISLIMTFLAVGSDLYKFRQTASLVILVSPEVLPDADTKLSIIPSETADRIDLSSPLKAVPLKIESGETVTLGLDNLTDLIRKLEQSNLQQKVDGQNQLFAAVNAANRLLDAAKVTCANAANANAAAVKVAAPNYSLENPDVAAIGNLKHY
jgi:hypothetical protein